MPVKVSIDVTNEELRNILISAIEGGIGYWAEVLVVVKR